MTPGYYRMRYTRRRRRLPARAVIIFLVFAIDLAAALVIVAMGGR